jgi:hypothetical protein
MHTAEVLNVCTVHDGEMFILRVACCRDQLANAP